MKVNFKILPPLFFNMRFLLIILSILFIRCSDKPKQQSVSKKAQTLHTGEGKPTIHQADSIRNPESDSLKTLLNAATQDTTRLRILDAMANTENDDDIIAGYNEQIETLVQKILVTNPPENLKTQF